MTSTTREGELHSSSYASGRKLIEQADALEYAGQKLIQARTFAAIALGNEPMYTNQREEDRDDDREYYIRKAYRLGEHVLDYLIG